MKYIVGFLLSFIWISSYASFPCPTNNGQQMSIGDSVQTVISECGSPTSMQSYNQQLSSGAVITNQFTPGMTGPLGSMGHGVGRVQSQTQSVQITEVYYNDYVLIFENGYLVHGHPLQ